MGLPVHCICSEFRETWIDTLRQELSGYATVESSCEPAWHEEEVDVVDVVGKHGKFTLRPDYDFYPSSFLLLMFPCSCNVKTHGRDMVNLQERIHCVFDKMSVNLTPEAIERYENSRWTKFLRWVGWEQVVSLDFAHRRKREIIDDDCDS